MNKTRKIEITVELIRIVAAVAIAYAIALLTLVVFSDEPVYIIQQFILGPFSSMRRLGSVINLAIPFTFTGLCFCFMYAVNKFNLAGEGTFMVSGCLTALVAIKIGDTLPPVVMIPLLLCVGALVGIILNAIPALLDIKFNANIVVVSLMLNSMLVFFAIWVLKYKMRDPSIGSLGSYLLPDNVLLPQWISWSAAVRDRIPRQVLCCCEASDQEADLYTFSDIVLSLIHISEPTRRS